MSEKSGTSMSGYHLAQINVARLKASMDHPLLTDFKNNLDLINALAEAQPGFVWRLTGEGNDATDIRARADDPLFAINMSVWDDLKSLSVFVYRTTHVEFMRRRREWAEHTEVHMALWWIPVGRKPLVEEGMAALERLERLGPTAAAFTFKTPFAFPNS